jgi:hypothetical protein
VWKAGVRDLQLEGNRVIVSRRNGGDVFDKEAVGIEAFVRHQRLDGEDHVSGRERFAVRPGDALTQRNRQRREIVVVVRVACCQTGDDLAGGEVDRPQRLIRQVLHPAVAPLPADPFVEVRGRADTPGEDVGDQRLVARQVAQPSSRLIGSRCFGGRFALRLARLLQAQPRTPSEHQARHNQQAQQNHPCASHSVAPFVTWTELNTTTNQERWRGTIGARPTASQLYGAGSRRVAPG